MHVQTLGNIECLHISFSCAVALGRGSLSLVVVHEEVKPIGPVPLGQTQPCSSHCINQGLKHPGVCQKGVCSACQSVSFSPPPSTCGVGSIAGVVGRYASPSYLCDFCRNAICLGLGRGSTIASLADSRKYSWHFPIPAGVKPTSPYPPICFHCLNTTLPQFQSAASFVQCHYPHVSCKYMQRTESRVWHESPSAEAPLQWR